MRRARPRDLLSLCLAGAACAAGPRPAPAPTPPRLSLTEDEIEAIAEILELEDRRAYDPERLPHLARDPEPEVRRRALLAMGRIGHRDAAPHLAAALADPHPGVQADAAFALGELGDTAPATVAALRRAAAGDDSAAAEAVAALGKLRTDAARLAVEEVLRAPTAAPATTAEALLALWRFPRHEHTAQLVLPFARTPDRELRWRATYALFRIADPATADELLRLLRDPDPLVRSLAARGLRAPLADSAGRRTAAAQALATALKDPHPHVRINALRALASYRDPALAPTAARHVTDPDPNVALTAVETLGALGGPIAASTLHPLLHDPAARPALRGAALAALLRVAPEEARPHADEEAGRPDWLARLYAARAFAAAPWTHAEPLVRRLARDPDPRVAAAALAAAAAAADTTAPARALFIEALASADALVRAAALQGLGRRPEPADLPLLLEAYERARHDTIPDAALAAIDALGALADRGTPVAHSFFRRFPRPEDPLVRARAAARIGPGWGPAWPAETGHDRDFYRRIVRELVLPELRDGTRPRVRVRSGTTTFTLELAPAAAPLTTHNFLTLARRGFFNGGRWHRVVPNFVLQDGDPRGDGLGGPGFAIRDEVNRIRYLRGTVGMALSGPDTGGSQFFVTHSPQPHLDGGYTAFGRVATGMDAADTIVQDDPIDAIEVLP